MRKDMRVTTRKAVVGDIEYNHRERDRIQRTEDGRYSIFNSGHVSSFIERVEDKTLVSLFFYGHDCNDLASSWQTQPSIFMVRMDRLIRYKHMKM